MSCTRPVIKLSPRSRTGIPGVGFGLLAIKGKKQVPHALANCGPRTFKFNITRLGRDQAFRQALRARAAYERGAL